MDKVEDLINKFPDARVVESLNNALNDNNLYVRRKAALALDKIGKQALTILINALKNYYPDVREIAAEALRKIGDTKAIESLTNALKHNLVGNEAAMALIKIGEPAIPHLINLLKKGEYFVDQKHYAEKSYVAKVLIRLGKPAEKPLINLLKNEDRSVRSKAAKILDKIGWKPADDSELVDYLIAKENWEDLFSMGKPALAALIKVLEDEDCYIRENAIKTLGKIGDKRAVDSLIKTLNDENSKVRKAAVVALDEIGDTRAVEPLIKTLEDENCYIRKAAIKALGKIRDTRAVEPLTKALKDEDLDVREKAVEVLGIIKDTRAVKPLIDAMKELEDKDWKSKEVLQKKAQEIRKTVVKTLGIIGGPSAIETLINTLKDNHPGVREEAVEALVKIGKPAVETLINELKDNNSTVREKAVEVLGKIKDTRAVGVLIDALKVPGDNEWKVQKFQKAAPIVKKLMEEAKYIHFPGKNSHYPYIRENRIKDYIKANLKNVLNDALEKKEIQKAAAKALGNLGGPDAVEALINTLRHRNWELPEVKEKAAISLNNIESEIAIDLLNGALWKDYSEVQKEAAWALGEIGDINAVQPLLTAMKDNNLDLDVRREARIALNKSGNTESAFLFIKALNDDEHLIRDMAARVLDGIGWKPSNNSELALYLIAKQEWNKLLTIGKDAVAPIINVLNDRDHTTRTKAIEALSKVNAGNKLELLIAALKNKDQYMRQGAADVLDKIAWEHSNKTESAHYFLAKQEWHELLILGKNAVGPLLNVLKDKDERIRGNAVETLGKIGEPTAVIPLIAVLQDEKHQIRLKIIEALGRLGGPIAARALIEVLKDENMYIRKKTVEALNTIGWKPANNSESALHLVAKEEWDKLPTIGKDAVEPLLNVIKDEEPRIRSSAVEVLGKIGDPMVVESLLNILNDENSNVRKKVVAALGNIGAHKAVRPLLNTLEDEQLYRIQQETITALGKIADPMAFDPLIAKLTDKKNLHHYPVIDALGKIGDARAVKPLIHFLETFTERNRYPDYNEEKEIKKVKKAVEKIRSKVPDKDLSFICKKCLHRCEKHKIKFSKLNISNVKVLISKTITYYACRNCHSNSYLIEGIEKVVLLLDHQVEDSYVQNGSILTANWFNRKEPFDFNGIRINDANDFDVEELVMKLRNDPDNKRRKLLPKIPVYLSPGLKISRAKMNMLEDNFKIVKWINKKK